MNQGTDYDPFAARDVKNPISSTVAVLCLLNSSLGIGLLSMPAAMKHAGYVLGVMFAFIFGIIALYCMHILFDSMFVICQRKRVPYLPMPLAMEVAFTMGPPCLSFLSDWSWCVINAVLVAYHFGVCSIYVVFIAETLKELSGVHSDEFDLRFFMLATFVPLMIVFAIPSIKYMTLLSVLGAALELSAIGTLFYMFQVQEYPEDEWQPFSSSIGTIPLFYGTNLYILEYVGMLMVVEANLKTPTSFRSVGGILITVVVLVIIINLICGVWGYMKFGESVKLAVSMNLPKDTVGLLTNSLLVFSILISFNLQGYVLMDVLFTRHLSGYVEEYEWEKYRLFVRIVTSILSVFSAMLIPDVLNFLQLLGGSCLTILVIILPITMNICVKYPDHYGQYKNILIRDCIIMGLGFFFGFASVISSIYYSIQNYGLDKEVVFFTKVAD